MMEILTGRERASSTTERTIAARGAQEIPSTQAVDAAIERGREALFKTQNPRGAWNSPADLGLNATAMQLVVEKHFGVLSERDAKEGQKILLAGQRADGSFEPHPHAEYGTASSTSLAYAALMATGLGARHPAAARAKRFVDDHGGFDGVCDELSRGDLTSIFLLMQGLVGPEFLPDLPLEIALLPVEKLIEGRMHAGNAMVMVVLLALADHHRGTDRRGLLRGALRALERRRIEAVLAEYQNPNGSWNQVTVQTLVMLVGLSAAGFTARDPIVARALDWLSQRKQYTSRGLEIEAMPTDVFTTALALLALLEAGVSRTDERVLAAVDFLLGAQNVIPMPRANQRRPGAPLVGSWSFQEHNPTMPDTDDTAMVLAALCAFAQDQSNRAVFAAIDRGLAWLRAMQNPDGGFPVFVWGLPSKKPGPMFLTPLDMSLDSPKSALKAFLNPPPELGDPSCEGVTGRVLWALAKAGVGKSDKAVRRAIEFMKHQQCETGAWWGRWKTCYLPETGSGLVGLAEIGEDLSQPYVERAIAFVSSCQNEDGGFGETAKAYVDPEEAGKGPSMPPVTAFVLAGLASTAAATTVSIDRAAGYLVRSQRPDGGWPNAGWLETFLPPSQMFVYPGIAETLPIYALARYRRLRARGPGSAT